METGVSKPFIFNVYMNIEMKEVKMGMGRRESGDYLASCI